MGGGRAQVANSRKLGCQESEDLHGTRRDRKRGQVRATHGEPENLTRDAFAALM